MKNIKNSSAIKISLVLQLIFLTTLFSQIKSVNNNPLVVNSSNLTENSIINKINSKSKWFSISDIENLKKDIHSHQNRIDDNISNIKRIISELVLLKQNLLKFSDIKKVKEQIVEKKRSKKKIEVEIKKDLTNVTYKGLFLVIQKNINILHSKEKLSSTSEKLMTSRVIEDLNGVFINSLSVIKDYKVTYDYIKSIIQGEMSVDKKYITKTLRKDKFFIYMAKVGVSPLKSNISTKSYNYSQSSNDNLVINLNIEKNYEKKLIDYGISRAVINNIKDEISMVKHSIANENQVAQNNQKKIIEKGNSNLLKIDSEIQNLEEVVIYREKNLEQLITKKTQIDFDKRNPELSLKKALSFFTDEIDKITNELLLFKEKELIIQTTKVISEGSPAKDIAKNTLSLVNQIKSSYGKIEQFLEETEVENFITTSYKKGQKTDIFRTIDKVWLYPVPGNDDDFTLAVVVKFKIKGSKPLKGLSIYEKYKDKNIVSFKNKTDYMDKYRRQNLLKECYTTREIITKSAIFPGVGQFRADRNISGTIFSTLFTGGLIYYGYNYFQSNSKQDDYDKVFKNFKNAYGDEKIKYSKDLKKLSNDIDDIKSSSYIALGVIGGSYLLNLLDVAFLTPEDPNIKLYDLKPKLKVGMNGEVAIGLNVKF